MSDGAAVKVLDSWPLMAFFQGEKASFPVSQMLKAAVESHRSFLMSVVNWGEILYRIEQLHGQTRVQEIETWMMRAPLVVVSADQTQTRVAAHYKAKYKMSYADCFAAALAKLRKATLVTGDKEFKAVENDIKILWL